MVASTVVAIGHSAAKEHCSPMQDKQLGCSGAQMIWKAYGTCTGRPI